LKILDLYILKLFLEDWSGNIISDIEIK
jgi:hypothetical protein